MSSAAVQAHPRRRRLLGRLPETALLVLAGLIVGRLAIAAAWLAADSRITDSESSRHLHFAWNLHDSMRAGDVLAGFQEGTLYPPVHHLVGALGRWIGGISVDATILAQDVLFVPALAIGTFGAASLAYGRLAGVLAAAFALSAPMMASAFHMFQIDTPMAAMTAMTVWLVLASERFSRAGIAAAAGAAFGVGMLVKHNFVMFVAGLLLVAFLRGGWRHWRGLLAFAVVGGALSATYYWAEIDRWLELVRGASAESAPTEAAGTIFPSRWTAKNIAWYGWNTLNLHLFVPMTLLFCGGSALLLVRWIRTRSPRDLTPEIFAGGLVAFLALTYIQLKDHRYALPATTYMAILGVGWIPLVRAQWRSWAAGAVAALCALNLLVTVAGIGPTIRPALAGAPQSSLGEREFTLLQPNGFIAGEPYADGEIVDLFRAAKADGVEWVLFDPGAKEASFNMPGLNVMARIAGLPVPGVPDYSVDDPRGMFVTGRWPGQDQVTAKPCMTLEGDGRRVYLRRGAGTLAFEQWPEYYCPPRR